ncbi:MAG: hypothetical protein NTV01_20230 [Bacteroidia bacterium]|nr:hypothetical protein [Bacteroidia bacterium]
MAKMNQKNTTGLFTFKNDNFPEWFAYTNDSTGSNIPVNKDGKVTTWSPTTNVFHFTNDQEKEIDEKINNDGFCTFKSTISVTFSEWEIKK